MKLELSQGNTYVLNYTIKLSTGEVKNLAGTLELKYQIAKKSHTAPVYSIDLSSASLNITNPSSGLVEVKIPSGILNNITPGKFIHELWQVDATNVPTTLVAEEILITSKLIKE